MTINKKITGIDFQTNSPRGSRVLTEADQVLAEKITAVVNRYNDGKKSGDQLQGYLIGFNIDGKIYAGCFPFADALKRIKVNKQVNKILQPLGIDQVLNLCDYVCTFEELQDYKNRMRGTKKTDNGTAFQKYLHYLQGTGAHLTNPFSNGGDLYRNKSGAWEVKYMALGNSQGSARLEIE